MINIIKADLYKYFKRPFLYILSILLIAISIFVPLILKLIDDKVTRHEIFNLCGSMLPYISIIVIILASVLLEEYSENTLKNTLPCNISKAKFFVGKYILQTGICLTLIIMSLVALIIATMFLEAGEGYTMDILLDFIARFLSCLPIYIASIAVVDFFVILLKREVIVYIFYVISVQMFPSFLVVMEKNIWSGFRFIKEGMFIPAMQPLTMENTANSEMIFAIALGIGYIIVFSIVNIKIFSNQEIK